MKKRIVLVLLCVFSISTLVQAQGIQFETGTWKQALEKAKKEKKLVFVDVYTTWCGPCRMVAETVFPQEKVGKFYNENYINYRFDAEKGEGPAFAKKYGVKAYPSFFYIDGDGNVIFEFIGGKDAEGFIKSGEMVPQFARYGGYDNMIKAVKSGMASQELFDVLYAALGEQERNDLLCDYLKTMPLDKFMTEGYKSFDVLTVYNEELMNQYADLFVKVSNDGRFVEGVYDTVFIQKIIPPFLAKASDFLEYSITSGDSLLFDKLMDLRMKCDGFAPAVKEYTNDVYCLKERLILTSGDYLHLYFWCKNRLNPEQFKEKLVTYMDALIKDIPGGGFRVDIMKLVGMGVPLNAFPPIYFRTTYLASDNILDWIDYSWKVSPMDDQTKALYMAWIKYAYNLQPFNIDIVKKAVALVNKFAGAEEVASLLEDAISVQVMTRGGNKIVKELEFMHQAAKNNKL